MIHLGGSVAGVFKVIGALGWGEAVKERADAPPGGLDASFVGLASRVLSFEKTCPIGLRSGE
jgi:hypothetical protein